MKKLLTMVSAVLLTLLFSVNGASASTTGKTPAIKAEGKQVRHRHWHRRYHHHHVVVVHHRHP